MWEKQKKEEVRLSHMTKALTQTESFLKQKQTTTNTATEMFEYGNCGPT